MTSQPLKRNGLPPALSELGTLTTNLAWSWNREARTLFKSISPTMWRAARHNPLELLQRVSPKRLEDLAADDEFMARYRAVRDSLSALQAGTDTWFARSHPESAAATVAYFCAEFGLHHSIPIYSGGLGILAGDHCKAAADLGVPLVGVGLMYTKGYFDQRLRLDGKQEDAAERFEHELAPIFRVMYHDQPSLATVRMSGRDVHIGAWRVDVGRVPVFLLDTNLEANDPADRELSQRLYAGGVELRLRQEWILGVGGVRVLRRLGFDPAAWHANEGHAAFMLLERLREMLVTGVEIDEAIDRVRAHSVFTTHTPVPAGHDVFDRQLIEHATGPIWDEIGLDADRFLELGRHPDEAAGRFHMTAMAIRLSSGVNGVSERHGSVSRSMWRGLFPEQESVPIGHVTNGVHAATWMSAAIKILFDRHFGPDWEQRIDDPGLWDAVLDIDDSALWWTHIDLKHTLLDFIHETARRSWRDHWTEAPQLLGAGALLNSNPLTLGFARRFATYKRADLIFRDVERLRQLLTQPGRPVQIIFAGKAHPADDPGKEVLQRVFGFAHDRTFEGRIAFLEDYEMHMARRLVQGVDVWLNLPRVPQEACGTSGMKAALNGVPQLGTSDGWWAEGHTGENGWRIPAVAEGTGADEHDALQLYEILEEKVVPAFYRRGADGVPREWTRCMKHAIREAGKRFTGRRMVSEYTRQYYLPALHHPDRIAGHVGA